MSGLSTVADHLIDTASSVDDIDATVAAIEYLASNRNTELTSASLGQLVETPLSQSTAKSLLYNLEKAEILTERGLNRERLRAAAGAAKTAVERGHRPENDVVVNVPERDNPEIGESLGSLVVRLVELIASANEEIVILNPFFTERAFGNVVSPVANALNRGVSVTLVTRYLTYGSDDDSRAFVKELFSECSLSGGELQLYEYIDPDEGQNATIHTKMTIVDRERAYLGTANLTHRGLHDNLEIGVIFRDDTVSQLVGFVDELQDSHFLHEITLEEGDFVRV